LRILRLAIALESPLSTYLFDGSSDLIHREQSETHDPATKSF